MFKIVLRFLELNVNGFFCFSVINVCGFCVVFWELVDFNKFIEDEVFFDKFFYKFN